MSSRDLLGVDRRLCIRPPVVVRACDPTPGGTDDDEGATAPATAPPRRRRWSRFTRLKSRAVLESVAYGRQGSSRAAIASVPRARKTRPCARPRVKCRDGGRSRRSRALLGRLAQLERVALLHRVADRTVSCRTEFRFGSASRLDLSAEAAAREPGGQPETGPSTRSMARSRRARRTRLCAIPKSHGRALPSPGSENRRLENQASASVSARSSRASASSRNSAASQPSSAVECRLRTSTNESGCRSERRSSAASVDSPRPI